jgi:hypothetical protein
MVAASLFASVPPVRSATRDHGSNSMDRVIETPQQLPLTAAPADRQSFYLQFYGTGFYSSNALPSRAERKPGLFRRFANAIKRSAQKVNLIPN